MSTQLNVRNPIVESPSHEIAVAITGTMEQLKAVRTFVASEFKVNVDYGKIPGCGDKASLLNPGAQKAAMYFNVYPTFKIKEKDLGSGHVEYRVRCILISRTSKEQVGEGVGSCSTKETKYKRGSARSKACPYCGVPAIARSKYQGSGFYCNAKAGGCGVQFKADDPKIADAPLVEVVDESAYEVRNTVLKMAKKRSFVDGTMTLGCLNELFTQDIVDTFGYDDLRDGSQVIDGEVMAEYQSGEDQLVTPTVPDNGSGDGSGAFASVEKTIAFEKWVAKGVKKAAEDWEKRWSDRMDMGHPVPNEIGVVLNSFGATGHLLKWAIETERLDPRIIPEDVKAAHKAKFLAVVYHRSEEDRAALRAEFLSYSERQMLLREGVVYRKNPELAPEGWASEQAEQLADPEDYQKPEKIKRPGKKELAAKVESRLRAEAEAKAIAENAPEAPWEDGRQ